MVDHPAIVEELMVAHLMLFQSIRAYLPSIESANFLAIAIATFLGSSNL